VTFCDVCCLYLNKFVHDVYAVDIIRTDETSLAANGVLKYRSVNVLKASKYLKIMNISVRAFSYFTGVLAACCPVVKNRNLMDSVYLHTHLATNKRLFRMS